MAPASRGSSVFVETVSGTCVLKLSLKRKSIIIMGNVLLFLSLVMLEARLPSLSLAVPFLTSFSRAELASVLAKPLSSVVRNVRT